ncbi:MAG: serine/threonine protein kinase [Planctomycetales bacterium]|nr:serine/threonine protein kinase [Planctomycetales bacterium]
MNPQLDTGTSTPSAGCLLCGDELLGAWRLRGKFAAGAMSEVYLAAPQQADDLESPAYVAKVLRPEWHRSRIALHLFQREAKVAATVANAHVISILDAHIQTPPYYVVMPRLEGTTLRDQLRPDRQLPLAATLWVARQVAEGLAALHEAGWVHGDIKPSNLFVSPAGHVTLLDLGYCRSLQELASVGQRPIVGTLNYLAPEAFTMSASADARSDFYSLGVVLYEMLTGRLPFEGRNPAEVAEMQRQGVPDRLRCLAPLVPRSVVDLVRSMMAKEPLRRPQSARELIARLVRLEIESLASRIPA